MNKITTPSSNFQVEPKSDERQGTLSVWQMSGRLNPHHCWSRRRLSSGRL